MTVSTFRRGSPSSVIRLAILSRVIILGGMILSDIAIPDHNPGDDVLRFDLRLLNGGDDGTSGGDGGGGGRHCFCLEGHACDTTREGGYEGKRRKKTTNRRHYGRVCATSEDSTLDSSSRTPAFIDSFYRLLLSPLTKWDSARFLSLAVDPAARIPKNIQDKPNEGQFGDDRFADSEQAHAFFPLFPLCIRYVALILVQIAPSASLPSTFEGVTALSAMLVNLICFVIAAISLYETTRLLLQRSLERLKEPEIERASYLVASLFCFNPASVFFTASYSESVFAALTFGGHALASRGFLLLAVVPWTLATYARSNGTFSSIWILLHGIGQVISVAVGQWTASAYADVSTIKKGGRVIKGGLPTMTLHTMLAVAIALPVMFHERRGYQFHCYDQDTNAILSRNVRPSWCDTAETSSRFSMYEYVQRKHWNVGFLNYYELKQIPNFLLALPVLSLGTMAAYCWIGTSWSRYLSTKNGKDGNKARRSRYFVELMKWAIFALDESAQGEAGTIESERDVQEGDTPSVKIGRALNAPYMLAHYAILTGFCIVGATVAHVQVSTRLICSSCPAFYWFLASLCFAGRDTMIWRVKVYLVVFNILGIILHPNFLPWT